MTRRLPSGAVAARVASSAVVLLALVAPAAPIAMGAAPTIVLTDHVEPRTLTIAPGDTITVENRDGTRHRLRSQTGPQEFDVDLDPGEQGSISLTALGTYEYVDDRDRQNTSYHGTIVVATAPATAAPPGTTAAPGVGPSSTATVTMAGRQFSPATVTIAAGGRVSFVNNDDDRHTATGDGFDTGVLQPGSRSAQAFPRAGTFGYLCQIHPDMRGTVRVVDSTGTAPTAAPRPRTPAPAPAPTAPPVGGAAGAALVRLVDFAMSPRTLDVTVGTRVTFRNDGAAVHTATASDGTFDSGLLSPAQRFTWTFATPGTYGFLCSLHPRMTGTIRVAGSSQAPVPSRAPSASPSTGAGDEPSPAVPPDPSAGSGVMVEILDASFRPPSLQVAAGTAVTWNNASTLPHSATAAGQFDSGILAPGDAFTATMEAPGTYPYVCVVHPSMQATIEVVAPGSSGLQGAVTAPGPSTAPRPPSSPPSSVEAPSPAQAGPADVLRVAIVLVLPAVGVVLFLVVVRGVARR